MSMRRFTVAACLGLSAGAALAQPQAVSLETRIFVETFATAPDGAVERQLKPAEVVVPGDRLVYVLRYRNNGTRPASEFVVTNPLPATVEFAGDESPGAEMSVDGGKAYGPLTQLTVSEPGGATRAARRPDVTHIRWRIPGAVAPKAGGEVMFKARLK